MAAAVPAPEASSSRLSRGSKDVLFGSLAGMAAKLFEHPFDLVKVRLQTAHEGAYAGPLQCAQRTLSEEGVRGIYRGLSMPIIGACFENATLFLTYNYVQAQLRRYNGEAVPLLTSSTLAAAEAAPLSMAQLSIAAAAAGAVTSCVLTPIELVKCRMQVQQLSNPGVAPKLLPGPLALVRDTLRTHGLRGLWLGQTGTLLRETGGGMAWFLAFEGVCRAAQTRRRNAGRKAAKQDLSAPELMLAGACAGVGYNVVLFPADSVKSTMQTTAELARAGAGAAADVAPATARNGFVATFRDIYRRRGVRGLYAGCGVTCLRSGPSSALIFLMYTKLEQLADVYAI